MQREMRRQWTNRLVACVPPLAWGSASCSLAGLSGASKHTCRERMHMRWCMHIIWAIATLTRLFHAAGSVCQVGSKQSCEQA